MSLEGPSHLHTQFGVEVALLDVALLASGLVEDVTAVFCGIRWLHEGISIRSVNSSKIRTVYKCRLTATSLLLGFSIRCKPSLSLIYVTCSL